MSTSYLVEVDMQAKGGFGTTLGQLRQQTQHADSALKGLGTKIKDLGADVRDAFTGAVEKVGALAMTAAKVGVVAAVGTIAYGVIGLNQSLENTKIGLATVFEMQGFSTNFQGGLVLAGATMEKLKQDVKSLPGDLGQLAGIFTTIAPAASIAGASIDKMRGLAGKTLAIGSVFGLDSGTSGREMSMLLSGRAGAHNILGMKLGLVGDSAKEFNKMSAGKRLLKIDELLKPAGDSIAAFGGSFTGLFTTLKDNIKYSFLGPATSPLFESVKHSLSSINQWFEANNDRVKNFADRLGSMLANAWEWGEKAIVKWGPMVIDFAEGAFMRLAGIWEKIEPYAEKFAKWMEQALSDPNGTVDKIEHVLELYGAAKIGGSVVSGLGAAGSLISIASAGKNLGLFGGGAAAAAEGVGAAGAAAAGGEVAVPALLSFGLAAIPVTGALVGLGAAIWQAKGLYDDISNDEDATRKAIYDAGIRLAKGIGESASAYDDATMMAHKLASAGFESAAASLEASINMRDAADAAERLAGGLKDIGHNISEKVLKDLAAVGESPYIGAVPFGEYKDPKGNKGKDPPSKSMSIAKVEIVITTNQDPSRVARAAVGELDKLRQHPRSSPDTRNYSASR